MIGIVDFGANNARSVANMLRWIGVPSIVSGDPDILQPCDKYILPGVGSFDVAVKSLTDRGLIPFLLEAVTVKRKPILGICLGMQLMLDGSEEGRLPGLSLIEGYSKKFVFNNQTRVPHMGWNSVKVTENQHTQRFNTGETQRFYFVHSYHAVVDKSHILFETEYNTKFTSGITNNTNVFGVQFHPEKSHKYGMTFLQRFVEFTND